MALDPASEPVPGRAFAHEDPYAQLARLDQKIREYVEPKTRRLYVQIKFNKLGERRWRAEADKALLESGAEIYLCADSTAVREELTSFVSTQSRFALTPASADGRAGDGLPLRTVNTPRGLPAMPNLHYFRLERTQDSDAARLWQRILQELQVAAYWSARETTKIDSLSFFVIKS